MAEESSPLATGPQAPAAAKSGPVDPLASLAGPEIFIGLVGPIGTDLDLLCNLLRGELEKYEYRTHIVRLSSLIRNISKYKDLPDTPADARYDTHMDAGSELRKEMNRGDALALFSTIAIRKYRQDKSGDRNKPVSRTAFVLRSLKHPSEIAAFRTIYGRAFFLFSTYAPRKNRLDALTRLIADSYNESGNKRHRSKAEHLITKDEEEEGSKLGQDVTDSFPLADFFVDMKSRKSVDEQITRFIEVIFGHPFQTPTPDEMAMFLARAFALRSADLSRQVGAVILDEDGEFVAGGCNEVPRAGGGLYWPGDPDFRDFQKGFDSSARYKKQIVQEVIGKFHKQSWFNEALSKKNVDELVRYILTGDGKSILQGTQVMNLLEFGRIVHAEMAAVSDAAMRGLRIKNGTLFCTTFPCHMCARHLLSAGIKKVVFIEPYPKSIARDLYDDSVVVDEDTIIEGRLNFVPFVGVAPRRYQEFFDMKKRKDDEGDTIKWEKSRDTNPGFRRIVPSYILIEQKVIAFLPDELKRIGLELNGLELN